MTHPKRVLFGTLIATSLLLTMTACEDSAPSTPYDREKLVEFMNHLDQQAYVIWGNSGSEWDKDGERELFPTTDEGWKELETAGHELVSIGESLATYIDEEDPRADAWLAYAEGISDVSQKLIVAAEQQDKKSTFDDGGVLYQVCKACHGTFPALSEISEERRP